MLPLTRPLICLDVETTSADPKTARIVELAFVLIKPDGTRSPWSGRFNPGVPIPPEATAVHGITDADVKDKQNFGALAERLANGFRNADLAGFNVRFDCQVLEQEFKRVDVEWSPGDAAVLDAFRFWQILEPRTLSDAYRHFCGRTLEGAHEAGADVAATLDVLDAQIAKLAQVWISRGGTNESFPSSVAALSALLWPRPVNSVDRAGKFVWRNGEAVIVVGKHSGTPLRQLPRSYLMWLSDSDFPGDARALAREALSGRYPVQEATR